MSRPVYDDLVVFLAIAREKSFTRAAARLGVSQSALSHSMRALEARLGVRLLTRTTRSVSLTLLGERLMTAIAPRFEEIDAELADVIEMRDKPAGTLRITASDLAVHTVVWPKLVPFLKKYPDIRVELDTDNANSDIVADGYDAGVRMGEAVAKDMVSMRIGPDLQFMVVATPALFRHHVKPVHPEELTGLPCINIRMETLRNAWAWEFARDGQEIRVKVEGPLMFNSIYEVLEGALEGFGLAYLPEELARPHLDAGRLVQVLEEWCEPWPGFHLYYPSRRQSSRVMNLLVQALKHESPSLA